MVIKKAGYSLRLEPALKKALEIAAKKDRRTVASLIEKLIVDYLDQQGIAWESNPDSEANKS